jgi:hypothetical protein
VDDWVRNTTQGGRKPRIFYQEKEYSKVVIETPRGLLIFGTLDQQVYDRVDIEEAGNFVTISYSVYEGTRNTRYRGMAGRRLIHKSTLIKDEVEDIEAT